MDAEDILKDLEKPEDVLEKRKEKIRKWLKNPYNALFTAILILAFIIRLIVFIKTLNQPLWWDEGEYASGALHWAIGAPSALDPIRELVAPFIWSLFYRIYPREFLWRLLQLVISFGLVIATYFCGKELFNKKIGLIASFFIACNSLLLFYTGRLLTYIWAPLFMTLIILFFYKGYVKKQGTKYIIYSILLFSFGFMAYWTVFLVVPIIFGFLLVTDKFKFIKDKALWISSIIGAIPLIIYFIISKVKTGIIHPRLSQVASFAQQHTFKSPFIYIKNFPHLFGWWWILFFIFGLFAIFELFIFFDLIIKGRANKIQKSKIFVFLWFLFVLGFFSIIHSLRAAPYWETFLFPLFPAFGIILALGFVTLSNICSKSINKKFIFIISLILILIAGGFQISKAQKIVDNGLTSFGEIAIAGEWLKQNSAPSDIVFCASHPQLTYHSQRKVMYFTNKEEDLMKKIKEENGKYFVLSPYDSPPSWVFTWPEKYPDLFIPVHAIPFRDNPQQAMVVIYEIQNENIINNSSV